MTPLQREIIGRLRRALTELEEIYGRDALVEMCLQLLAILEDSLCVKD